MSKPYYDVVCGIIKKDDLIFCCQKNKPGECHLKWEFPGGKVEKGESFEQALVREIKEELDCDVLVKEHIVSIPHEYQSFKITLHVYYCHIIKGTIKLLEHKDSFWGTLDELKKLDFVEADYQFLDLLK